MNTSTTAVDNSVVTITVTPLQAGIIYLALQEYQADFESQINGFELTACPVELDSFLNYVRVVEETAAARIAIENAKIFKP